MCFFANKLGISNKTKELDICKSSHWGDNSLRYIFLEVNLIIQTFIYISLQNIIVIRHSAHCKPLHLKYLQLEQDWIFSGLWLQLEYNYIMAAL